MNVCTAPVTTEKTRRIDEFYIPVEKQPRVGTPPNTDNVVNVEENTDLQSDTNMPNTADEETDTVNSEWILVPWSFMSAW